MDPAFTLGATPARVSLGNLSVIPDEHRAWLDGHELCLTHEEFEMLVLLAGSRQRVVRYGELELALWGRQGLNLRARTSVLLCRLRAKLAGMQGFRIETVRRVGYRWRAE